MVKSSRSHRIREASQEHSSASDDESSHEDSSTTDDESSHEDSSTTDDESSHEDSSPTDDESSHEDSSATEDESSHEDSSATEDESSHEHSSATDDESSHEDSSATDDESCSIERKPEVIPFHKLTGMQLAKVKVRCVCRRNDLPYSPGLQRQSTDLRMHKSPLLLPASHAEGRVRLAGHKTTNNKYVSIWQQLVARKEVKILERREDKNLLEHSQVQNTNASLSGPSKAIHRFQIAQKSSVTPSISRGRPSKISLSQDYSKNVSIRQQLVARKEDVEDGKLEKLLGRPTVGSMEHTRQGSDILEKVDISMQESERLKEENTTREDKSSYLEQERAAAWKARVQEIKNLIQRAQELDIAFLVDATASVQSSFDTVRNEISAMVAGISRSYPQCKLRFALAIYRDYNDSADGARGCDFTSSFRGPGSEFSRALSRIKYRRNRDFVEDVFSGLESAAALNWQSTNRVLVHVGDAPCHGRQFHDMGSKNDDYYGGDKLRRNIHSILHKLRESCKITLYCFCHLTTYTLKMMEEFRKAAGEDRWVEEWQFPDNRKIAAKVVAVSRSTIAGSLSVLLKGGKGDGCCVREEVVGEIPRWPSIETQEGVLYIHEQYSSLSELLDAIRNSHPLKMKIFKDVEVRVSRHPFSGDGAVRWSYYGFVTPKKDGRPCVQLSKRTVVLKRFNARSGKSLRQVHAKEGNVQQMEVQTVAEHMAEQFNERTAYLGGVMKVQFPKVCLLDVGDEFYTTEKLLRGEWVCYSNNGSYVNMTDYAPTLQAFSHWTYHVFKGLLMVTDLQGVIQDVKDEEHSGKHILCDPAIHTDDQHVLRFTGTNLGERMFKLFLDNHKCNDVCRHLALPAGIADHTYQDTGIVALISPSNGGESTHLGL